MHAVALLLLSLSAQAGAEKNPFRAEVTDAKVAPGGTTAVTVSIMVPRKHHVFRDMLEVTVVGADGLVPGEVSYPPGVMAPDTTGTNGGQPRESYESDVRVDVPFAAPADARPGPHPVTLHVRYQGCSETLCFFPEETDLSSTVVVNGIVPPPATTPPVQPVAVPATGCAHGVPSRFGPLGVALAFLFTRARMRHGAAGSARGAPDTRSLSGAHP